MSFQKPKAKNQGGFEWDEEDEEKLLKLGDDDSYTLNDIAEEFESRSKASVKNKLRKLRKAKSKFAETHEEEKYGKNKEWIRLIEEELDEDIIAFEGYSGIGRSASGYLEHLDSIECCEIKTEKFKNLIDTFSQQKNSEIIEQNDEAAKLEVDDTEVTCFNEDVNNVLHRKVGKNEKFNFIDLDPCGSPFVSVPQAIRLIEDGYLAVTYGDIGLKRWGRDTPLMKAYRMPSADGMWEALEYMIGWTMFEGVRQSEAAEVRKLEVVDIETFKGINEGTVRVLFRVEKVGSLNPVMNYLTEVLDGFDEEKGPASAKYRIKKED